MKRKATLFYALLLAVTLVLAGCQGDEGPAGAPGAQGEPGTPGSEGGEGPTGPGGTTGGLPIDPFQAVNFHGFSNSSLAKITATPTTLSSPNLGKPIVNGPNNPANPCVTITNASINGTGNLEVNFEVKKTVGADRKCGTADDGTYTGSILDATIGGSALTPSFIFAQLRPGDGPGDSTYWVNYVNGTATKVVGYGDTAEGTKANQPSSESHTNSNVARKGTLVDHANDATPVLQTYTYTTKAVVTAPITIAAPVTMPAPSALKSGTFNYNNNLIRVGIQMSGVNTATAYRPGAANNAIYDLVPAGAPVATRDIVDVQSCNDGCHTTLALHGGGRLDTKLCVMCHNVTAGDPHSGNVLDLKVMVHKIHMGKNLPSVKLDFVGELAGEYGRVATTTTPGRPVIEPFLEDANGQLSLVNPAGPIKGKPYRIWGRLVSGVPAGPVDFTEVGFPANPANCQKCHTGTLADVDNWKTKPSREACGSCHDGINFDNGTGDRVMYPSSKVTPWFRTAAEDTAANGGGHKGGIQLTNADCATTCHPATGTQAAQDTDPAPVPAMHGDFANGWSKAKYNVIIDTLQLSPPANGQYYDTAVGEIPTVTIKFRNVNPDGTPGDLIDPSTMTAFHDPAKLTGWAAANLYVSGPRALRKPVLTTAAEAQLRPATAGSTAGNNLRTETVNTAGTVFTPNPDTKITRTADSIIYQLGSTKGLIPGTYAAFVYAGRAMSMSVDSDKSFATKLTTFQVGTATVEKKIAGCTDCHDTTVWHDNTRISPVGNHPAPFDPEYCGNCHDYLASSNALGANGQNWKGLVAPSTGNANNLGFGAGPISRRVHGVHNGGTLRKTGSKMLNYPFEIYNGHNVSIVFPQDVRNCEKCHNGNTSGTWKTKTSRLACLSCHDSDGAFAHSLTNYFDPTPEIFFANKTSFPARGPYSGDEKEACPVCHSPNP